MCERKAETIRPMAAAYALAEDLTAMLDPIIVQEGFSLALDGEDCPLKECCGSS